MKSSRIRSGSVFAITFGLFLVTGAHAQTTGQLRLGADLKYPLAEGLQFQGGTEARFASSPATFNSILPSVRLKYQFLNPLALGLGYRLKYQRDNDETWKTRHRVFFDVAGKTEYQALRLKLRLRIQDQVRETAKGETRHRPTLRTRIAARWAAWRTFLPWLAAEHSFALDAETPHTTKKWRLSLGLSLKRNDYAIGISYRLDMPVADADAPTAHIVGLEVKLDPWNR